MDSDQHSLSSQILSEGKFSTIFPGWGASRVLGLQALPESRVMVIGDTATPENFIEKELIGRDANEKLYKNRKIGTLFSLSIAGCDLMGSCLYTAGVCTVNSGKLAPLGLFSVTLMLYFFRRVYGEVVSAIPINGGTYNLLLNTAPKKAAAFVATLSILSYMATAIVSAFSATVYLSLIWPECNIRLITILILVFFACVTICGVSESAYVTLCMFSLHLMILTLLIIWGLAYGIQDNFTIFQANLKTPYPTILNSDGQALAPHNSGIAAWYFGYCSALLGITGFETASNYVQEMKSSKVFIKTVNWMWILVGVYNPLISLTSLMVMPIQLIYDNPSSMLAVMASILGGNAFRVLMSINAVIILCGGVLTALVGVSGLLKRLASDNILPQALSITNSRGSAYVAIIVFTCLAVSLFVAIFNPANPAAINEFGGVFAIAFLSVLICFTLAAFLLKLYRPSLARRVISKWIEIFMSLICVMMGFVGNIVLTPNVFFLFLAYLSGFIAVVTIVFARVELFALCIWILRRMNMSKAKWKLQNQHDEAILKSVDLQEAYNQDDNLYHLADSEEGAQSHPHHHLLHYEREYHPSLLQTNDGRSHKNSDRTKSAAAQSLSPAAGGSSKVQKWSDTIAKDIIHVRKRISSMMNLITTPNGIKGGDLSEQTGTGYNHITCAYRTESATEIQLILANHHVTSRLLKYCMHALDSFVSQPCGYLCKGPDPIALHLALEYIVNNEVTNQIYVIHFVDDRRALEIKQRALKQRRFLLKQQQQQPLLSSPQSITHNMASSLAVQKQKAEEAAYGAALLLQVFTESDASGHDTIDKAASAAAAAVNFDLKHTLNVLPSHARQLMRLVAILDTLYTYKKVTCVIVRGMFFCPRALDVVSQYLQIMSNSMVMGIPDDTFPFPIAELHGVRLVVPDCQESLRKKSYLQLRMALTEHLQHPMTNNANEEGDNDYRQLVMLAEEKSDGKSVEDEIPGRKLFDDDDNNGDWNFNQQDKEDKELGKIDV